MTHNRIPKATFGSIGGSNTYAARFPEDYERPGVRLIQVVGPFETPFGLSARFKLIEIAGEPVLRVGFHGCYPTIREDIVPWIAAAQVAWVFEQAGIKYAITDGSVGGIQPPNRPGELLPPWSAVVPDDFLMAYIPPPHHLREDGRVPRLGHSTFYRMAEPFCAGLRQPLVEAARRQSAFIGVHDGGIYACTRWGRFETAAEIRVLLSQGATVVGQTIAYETAEMRSRRIHFASLNVVSNHGEGRCDWSGPNPDDMAKFYRACPESVANTLLDAFEHIIRDGVSPCRCHEYVLTGMDFPVDIA